MTISRMDLADAATPEKLVLELLKLEAGLKPPIPIEELALKLDIKEIVPLKTQGYEGGLITTPDKFDGIILYNGGSSLPRKRFTIAHELGHFLMPSHLPSAEGRFLCRMKDMLALRAGENDRRLRMEVEANRFASLLLMPPPLLRKDAAVARDPSLEQIVKLADYYRVSKEALARSYIQMREEPAAIVVTQEAKLLRDYRVIGRFPVLSLPRDAMLPVHSLLRRRQHKIGEPSSVEETDAGIWIDVQIGRKAPTLYEQVLVQRNGFAMTLLWLEYDDENEEVDEEADLTAKQRYNRRIER